ncbi:hypothetical protein EX895_002043 [Sporisorium graminicola]|uniref:Uncharacterized protein n=1 Tax=Sporisorium graminicola TaxID=280036 RepID=A0A4U7L2J1_9BASI|nr:hypothetical protein EX895_002043 [Sporisorium graminicola]TKY89512.1 hypothetical protein EX895_002043 [Sporisorium graminicola]
MALAHMDRASPLKTSALANRSLNAKEMAAKDQVHSSGSNKPLVEEEETASWIDKGKRQVKGKAKDKGSASLQQSTLKGFEMAEKIGKLASGKMAIPDFRRTQSSGTASKSVRRLPSGSPIAISSGSDESAVPKPSYKKAAEHLGYGTSDPEKTVKSSPKKPKSGP